MTIKNSLTQQTKAVSMAIFKLKKDCFINPRHPRWKEYVGLKRKASVLLTQKAIAKAFDYDPDQIAEITKEQVKAMIDEGLLRNHAKRPSRVAYGALRRLRALARACRAVGMAVVS